MIGRSGGGGAAEYFLALTEKQSFSAHRGAKPKTIDLKQWKAGVPHTEGAKPKPIDLKQWKAGVAHTEGRSPKEAPYVVQI
jgi:hypothetical protein